MRGERNLSGRDRTEQGVGRAQAYVRRHQVHVIVSDLEIPAKQARQTVQVDPEPSRRFGRHQSSDHSEETAGFCEKW